MQLMQDIIQTHIYTIYIFLFVMLLNLYFVITDKNFISIAKKLKFMTPIYHLINTIVIYTGTMIIVYNKQFSLTIVFMIIASIFLLVIEIKRYKKMRVIKSQDTKLQEDFYKYAKKIYIIEILVLVLVYIISKVF